MGLPQDNISTKGPSPRVELVQLDLAALTALADGDVEAANRTAPVPLEPAFDILDWRGVWRRRRDQVTANLEDANWVTRVIWDSERRVAVGRAGYHGPPDARGMVEVGYGVDPTFRRRGYARAALEALLERARNEPEVRVVRATISPDNTASRDLVLQYGFVPVGEQWDEEDGLEIIYEVAAD